MKNVIGLLSPRVPPGTIGKEPSRRRRAPRLLFLPVVGALLLQAACRAVPTATAPKPQAPVGASVANVPITHGWMGLGDPELDRLFEKVEAQNLSSRDAASRLRASRARLSMAPKDDSTASRLANGGGGPAEFWKQGFDATWEMPLFAVPGRHGTVGDRLAPTDEGTDAMVSFLAEVARDYLELRSLRHRSDLTIDSLVIQENVLALTHSLAHQRLATDLDCSRARDQLGQARARLAPIQDGISRAVQAIATLLDQDPNALAAELDRLGPAATTPSLVGADLSSDLLRGRPDVRRAERWVEGTNPRIAAALAHDYPKFNLTGSFPYDSARFSDALSGTSRCFPGRPEAVLDLSNFGQTAVLAAHESGNQQQALLAYQYTLLSALRDVEDALTAFRQGQEQERNLGRAVERAGQALEGSRSRYMMGTIDYMEVLAAERQLLLAQDDLAQSRQAVALHWVALYKALGGNWESPNAKVPHRT